MPFTAPQPRKKGFDAGVYDAVCYSVLDLGIQEDKFGTAHKMLIGWKMLDYTYEDGNYVSYHQTFTVKLSERAKLTEVLSGWFISEEVDWSKTCFSKLLNKACKIVLAPNMNGNISVKNVLPSDRKEVMDNTEFFSFDDWKKENAEALPEFFNSEGNGWKADRIKSSLTYREIKENVNGDVVVEEEACE